MENSGRYTYINETTRYYRSTSCFNGNVIERRFTLLQDYYDRARNITLSKGGYVWADDIHLNQVLIPNGYVDWQQRYGYVPAGFHAGVDNGLDEAMGWRQRANERIRRKAEADHE